MVDLLLQYNIKPVFVFDGRSLPMKRKTVSKRQSIRKANEAKAQKDIS